MVNPNAQDVTAHTRVKSSFNNTSNPNKVNSGSETLRCLGPKVCAMIPIEGRTIDSLHLFKTKIKKWIPSNCPGRLGKCFIPQLGYL